MAGCEERMDKLDHRLACQEGKTSGLERKIDQQMGKISFVEQSVQDLAGRLELLQDQQHLPMHIQEKENYLSSNALNPNALPYQPASFVTMPQNGPMNFPVAKYDGKTSWLAYQKQFDVVAKASGWTESQKALQLIQRLYGQARDVLEPLSTADLCNYDILCKALCNRFQDSSNIDLARSMLEARRWQKNENLHDLKVDIERLVKRAYPTGDETTLDAMARDKFIEALGNDRYRCKLREARVRTLKEALDMAITVDSVESSKGHREPQRSSRHQVRAIEEHAGETVSTSAIREMGKQLAQIRELLEKRPSTPSNSQKPSKTCFICGDCRHFANRCPQRTTEPRRRSRSETRTRPNDQGETLPKRSSEN